MAKVFQVDTGPTLTTNLISYWKQEDLTDFFSTNNQTGVGSPTFTAGKAGLSNALTLNGSSQYTTIPSGVLPHQQNMAIALWFKMNTTGVFYLGGETGGGNNFYFDWNNNLTDRLTWNKLVGSNFTISYAWTHDTNWHLLILNHNSVSGMEMFLDNVSVGTNANTTAPGATSAVMELGSYSGLNSPLNGQIDEVGFWSKTLSSTERTDLWNGGAGQTMVEEAAFIPQVIIF